MLKCLKHENITMQSENRKKRKSEILISLDVTYSPTAHAFTVSIWYILKCKTPRPDCLVAIHLVGDSLPLNITLYHRNHDQSEMEHQKKKRKRKDSQNGSFI